MSVAHDSPTDEASLRDRIVDNPRPAMIWAAGVAVLLALEFGALMGGLAGVLEALSFVPGAGALASVFDSLGAIPSLTDRELIPNQGYYHPDEGWVGTFLGLSPAQAWAIRVAVIYAYSFTALVWAWKGYTTFREHYRYADWTPRDDMVGRLRSHYWGLFGLFIVFAFLVFALFAPTIGPTTIEQNVQSPYSNEIEYYNASAGDVETILVGEANLDSMSKGNPQTNVGVGEYDDYDRYHPFGTLSNGKDLFTFLAGGARISLFIGILSMGLAGGIALTAALASAYYKGLVDLLIVISSDSLMSLPTLPLLILLSHVLGDHPVSEYYNGALLLALIFALIYWPLLWRAIRGPAFQIADQEWIDAARSYGQSPGKTMERHMAPYVISYLIIYASMSLGGVIIAVAGLSFLGLGITAPTPEWGRAIDLGQDYVTTSSWHISLIPGFLIVLVVTAFNALGDGIRDALDPESNAGEAEEGGSAAATGGGGA